VGSDVVGEPIADHETTKTTAGRCEEIDDRARGDSRGYGDHQTVWMGRAIAREYPEATRPAGGHCPFYHSLSDRTKE
jgi:hypothetical protein